MTCLFGRLGTLEGWGGARLGYIRRPAQSVSEAPFPTSRRRLISSWGTLPPESRPDFASVNLSEEGAIEVCSSLLENGIGVEAGIWSAEDARLLIERGLPERCVRLLIELVKERTKQAARATAEEIERVLDEAEIRTPRLLHGEGAVAWPMFRHALERRNDSRIGLEDTLVLPDGGLAQGNEELVKVAVACARAYQS